MAVELVDLILGSIFFTLVILFILTKKQRHQPRIILWSALRCVSTAFERAIMEIPNGKIFHEPYSIALYFGPNRVNDEYLTPDKYQKYKNVTYDSITNLLTKEYNGFDYIFSKDMAYYVTQTNHFMKDYYLDLLTFKLSFPKFYHTFLIRKPNKVIVSQYKISKKK
eukprot:541332_1